MVALAEQRASRERVGDRGAITDELLASLLSVVPHTGGETGTIPVVIPFTGEVLGEVRRCNAATVARAPPSVPGAASFPANCGDTAGSAPA